LEDDPADVRLVRDTFSDDGLCPELTAVDNREDFLAALARGPDLILADYALPTFDGLEALSLCRALCPELPFIFLTGAIGEERAIETIKSGATDYVLKTRLCRLNLAVHRAIAEAEDIAQRKHAEEALRTSQERLALAVSGTQIGMFDWNLATGEMLWTEQHARLWGLSAMIATTAATTTLSQPYHYRDWAERIHADDLPRVETELHRCIAERSPFEIEYRIVWPDDSVHWIACRGVSHYDVQGQPHRVLGVVMDITDRKRDVEQLTAAKAAAEAANQAKSRFLANISHELRTPMNAILGMIDITLSKAADPTVQDCLQTAKGSADLLLTLLDGLLDSAKIESGKLELESAPFSLRRMLDQITRVLSVRAAEKGLCFRCRVPETAPDAVLGDRMRLQQVLLNLAGNAIKFTERGEVEVGLRIVEQGHEGLGIRDCGFEGSPIPSPQSLIPSVTLEFAVQDTGIGIPPSGLERLFQPFVQGDASLARRFGGTGLGLSICKSLVQMMGGQIRVESEPGQGSTFFFNIRLPLAKELPVGGDLCYAVPKATCAPLRILLVEDNPANQKVAWYILQERGHFVEIAGDGQEAIDLTEKNRYDVILMDVQMPEISGLEATAAIRKRESARTPIVAMTAHAMQSDRDRCLAAGMDGYLCKPVEREELIETVERLAENGLGMKDDGLATRDEGLGVFDQPDPLLAHPCSRIPDSPPFNLNEAMARLDGKFGLFREMAGFFFSDGMQLLPEIRAAAAAGNATAVEKKAHRLKGTVLYLGAKAATETVARVETLGRSGDLADADAAIRSMEEELTRLAAALRPYGPDG